MLGAKSQEEMIGLPVMQFIHPDYRPLVLGRLKELAQGIDQLQATDEKFVRLGGEVIDVEVIAKTINFNGEKAFQIIFTDITEKKIISKEKERLNSEILIQNQELAFQEEELRSANEELLANKEELEKILNELSNRNFELDQLVYKISHDLRAPLSTILGLVSIYKIEEKPEKQAEYIDLVENRVHKLDGFIKSMLNYAKANRTEIILQDIDFKELIHSCISDLEYLSYFDEINIELSINDDIEGYQGDLLRLKILFSNIISNAYKYRNPYSKESFIKINIQKKEEQFFIEFIDNGMGIEEIHIDKIFNMFYRATTHSEGSGLGLYIVKQTIDKLNGFIQIESEYGEGTVLKIFLPF
jgi:signal transduction histidine kinase